MDKTSKDALWGQFGACIDMLENAILACPDEIWSDPSQKPERIGGEVVGYWYLAYHTLFFLDAQLSGGLDGFVPPLPFDLRELDPEGLLPERAYTKGELITYLRRCREGGRNTIAALTDELAGRACRWGSFELTFLELLFYGMRHVQHHTAQLNLLLRQADLEPPRWVKRTQSPL